MQEIAATAPMSAPNISIAMIDAESGVFAAAARSETMPIAANVPRSNPSTCPNVEPAVAPTKKIGVTMPPLPPAASETAV
jgi:hypothetical protein